MIILDFEFYPLRLICQTTYRNAASAYVARLDNAESKLFLSLDFEDEFKVLYLFRDLLPTGESEQAAITRLTKYVLIYLQDSRGRIHIIKTPQSHGSVISRGLDYCLVENLATKRNPLY